MTEIATLGAGCFWCVEAVFSSLAGVSGVQVGYCNGETQNPTYEMVCGGSSGYAEVAQISFDPDVISFEKYCLRKINGFWTLDMFLPLKKLHKGLRWEYKMKFKNTVFLSNKS